MNWFTADSHLGHTNIIKYCNRPFKSIEHMDREIIRRWNERVKPNDTVYHLGDLCFRGDEGNYNFYREQLHGNLVLLRGNHDCFSKDTRLLTRNGYKYYTELKVGELIPTVNIETKRVEYKPINEIIINHVDKAYTINSRTLEGSFSCNHRLLTVGYNQHLDFKRFYEVECSELWKRKSYLQLPSCFISKNDDYQIDDKYLRLLAWIYTDGGIEHIGKYSGITFYQSKIRGILIIRELLSSLNIQYNEVERSPRTKIICGKVIKSQLVPHEFSINAEQTRKILNELNIYNKYDIPEYLWRLSDRQMMVLIDEMVIGNGSITNGGTKVIWGTRDSLYDILGLCVTHGIDANLVQDMRGAYYLSVHVVDGAVCSIKHIYPNRKDIINYDDMMWCVNVDNHIIFTELNGKTLISCNSNNGSNTILTSAIVSTGGHLWYLSHSPSRVLEYNLHGHIHTQWKVRFEKGYVLVNVGVDVWNFMPVSISEILGEISKQKYSGQLEEE